MENVLTIDLEEWHQLAYRRVAGKWTPPSENIFRQLDSLLFLLDQGGAIATFFVLGVLAQRYPDLVRRTAAQGHEIASHGYAHVPIHDLSRMQFEEDTNRAKRLLEDITGKPIRGYRAAEFSIGRRTLWALDVLAELGFEYDSSIFPIRHRRYGIADFYPQVMRYGLRNGLQIVEVPLTTIGIGKLNLPVAGGGYFRLMPSWVIKRALRHINKARKPAVTYFHPYEFDPQELNVFELRRPAGWKQRVRGLQLNFHQNLGRRTMPVKLAGLLRQFRFTTCGNFLDAVDIDECRTIFSPES